MSSNIQRLGNALANRMKKTADAAVPTTLELGIISDNLSLTTDSLRSMIPKGEYMVNLMLTTTADSVDEGGDALPENSRCLQDGDRVLVAWCGNEPVVVAIVVSS